MNSSKRRRGRPMGTGLNDGPTLKKVADMIVANPSLLPTTAIRRALDKPEPSNIRRLQAKWKAGSVEHLADAQARQAAAVLAPTSRASGSYSPRTIRQIADAQRAMQETLGPGFRAAQEMMNSPAMRAIEELRGSSTMQAIEEFQNSPATRAMRELQDSPIMRAAREMANLERLIRSDGF